jgi:hypothetical protein
MALIFIAADQLEILFHRRRVPLPRNSLGGVLPLPSLPLFLTVFSHAFSAVPLGHGFRPSQGRGERSGGAFRYPLKGTHRAAPLRGPHCERAKDQTEQQPLQKQHENYSTEKIGFPGKGSEPSRASQKHTRRATLRGDALLDQVQLRFSENAGILRTGSQAEGFRTWQISDHRMERVRRRNEGPKGDTFEGRGAPMNSARNDVLRRSKRVSMLLTWLRNGLEFHQRRALSLNNVKTVRLVAGHLKRIEEELKRVTAQTVGCFRDDIDHMLNKQEGRQSND